MYQVDGYRAIFEAGENVVGRALVPRTGSGSEPQASLLLHCWSGQTVKVGGIDAIRALHQHSGELIAAWELAAQQAGGDRG